MTLRFCILSQVDVTKCSRLGHQDPKLQRHVYIAAQVR